MKMGRKSASHELVKECIYTALMDLMEKEDYDKITITDITNRAGVSRMSYYRLYQSKDDIIETHLIEVFEEMHRKVAEQPLMTDQEFFTCFFTTAKENALLLRNCIKANVLEFFLREIKNQTYQLFHSYFQPKTDSAMLNYRICFFAGGFQQIAREWLDTGMQESVETMAAFSCSIADKIRQLQKL